MWIDNLIVSNQKGKTIFKTSFGKYEKLVDLNKGFPFIFLILVYFFIVSRLKNLKLRLLTNLYVLFGLLTCSLFYYYILSERYLDEPGFDDNRIDMMYRDFKQKYTDELRIEKKKKIFFYGGFKTLGNGAREVNDRWTNVIQEIARKSLVNFSDYSFFNWGIPSADTNHILKFHKELHKQKPKLTILLVGINDRNEETFASNISEMIKINKQAGIKTILLEESTYMNELAIVNTSGSNRYFQKIKPFCSDENVTCVEVSRIMYDSQNRLYDTGIRWVEWVHFNSYGQKLFATIIAPYILKELSEL